MRESKLGFSPVHTRPSISMTKIDAVVSANLGPARVVGNAQPNALYRHIAMYLCKHVGGWSTTQIGRFYNGRDHSTVHYAVRKIAVLRTCNPEIEIIVSGLTDALTSGQAERVAVVAANTSQTPDRHGLLFSEAILDALADRIAERLAKRSDRICSEPTESQPELCRTEGRPAGITQAF